MIPIGLVTRNRHAVLDVTLRSLSAADLPEDQVLIVFDDGSDKQSTLDYLYSDKNVHVGILWPEGSRHWKHLNLDEVQSKVKSRGLDGKIRVVRLGTVASGVVNASCRAFCWMTEKFGVDHGIVIVQDDVVFNPDWLPRLLAAEQHPEPHRRPIGMIAGCWINKKNPTKREPMTRVEHGGITAQCYYVTPAGIEAVLPWAQCEHGIHMGFDNKFCSRVRGKTDVYRMHPAVCQHVGLDSLVRPRWKWNKWNAKGRVDFSARGPYPLARYVGVFSHG